MYWGWINDRLAGFLADVLDFSTDLWYNNRGERMTLEEEILQNKEGFLVRSNEGLHEILFARKESKYDSLLVGFNNNWPAMMNEGLYFDENGIARGVPYKIIRREDAENDRKGNDGFSGGSEGTNDKPKREVAQVEGGTTDTAGDS